MVKYWSKVGQKLPKWWSKVGHFGHLWTGSPDGHERSEVDVWGRKSWSEGGQIKGGPRKIAQRFSGVESQD